MSEVLQRESVPLMSSTSCSVPAMGATPTSDPYADSLLLQSDSISLDSKPCTVTSRSTTCSSGMTAEADCVST